MIFLIFLSCIVSIHINQIPLNILNKHVLSHLSDKHIGQLSTVSRYFHSAITDYINEIKSVPLEKSVPLMIKLINQPIYLEMLLNRFKDNSKLLFSLLLFSLIKSLSIQDRVSIVHRLPPEFFIQYFQMLIQTPEGSIEREFVESHLKIQFIDMMEWAVPVAIYYGQIQNGLPHGYGISFFKGSNQLCYKGTWTSGIPNGYGTRYFPNGNKYAQGQFKNGLLDGTGYRYNANGGLVYKGGFKGNYYHGYGVLYVQGRKYYAGGWSSSQKISMRTGFGIEYDLETGQIKQQGLWIDGKLQKPTVKPSRHLLEYFKKLENYPLIRVGPMISFLLDYPIYFKAIINHFCHDSERLRTLQMIFTTMNPIEVIQVLDKMPSKVFKPYLNFLEKSISLQNQQFLVDYLEIPVFKLKSWDLENAVYHGQISSSYTSQGYGHLYIRDSNSYLILVYEGEWKSGLPFGNGIRYDLKGRIYQKGVFEQGKFLGE